MNLTKFKYENKSNDGTEFRFRDWLLGNFEVVWDGEALYVGESMVGAVQTEYDAYVEWVRIGDCWDGLDDD